jgi:hypothetical protein
MDDLTMLKLYVENLRDNLYRYIPKRPCEYMSWSAGAETVCQSVLSQIDAIELARAAMNKSSDELLDQIRKESK